MQKLNDVKEVLSYLNEGEIVTSNGKDQFVMKNKKIYRYSDGSHYGLNQNDFIDLYRNSNFYLYEEPLEIDDKKDEEYYRYYKK